jgi:nucleoside-diphosphate-sugar epimerase
MIFLISGTSSGLGKYLHSRFGGIAFRRDQPIHKFIPLQGPYDAVIHCAFNSSRDISHDRVRGYFHDNTGLTEQLVALPHRRFVYISTADVYPKDPATIWTEAHEVKADDILGVYAISKFLSEAIVRESTAHPLILRPTALLGRWMRPNTVTRILSGAAAKVGLNGDSTFNFVRYEDAGDIIEEALREDVSGILNVASSAALRLADVAHAFNRKVEFGGFIYRTVELANQKAAKLAPALNRTSLDILKSFWDENGKHLGRSMSARFS